jgi:hypothetical protein
MPYKNKHRIVKNTNQYQTQQKKIQTCKGLRQHGGPFLKTCQLSITRKQPPKKKTAKTTRIQRNSRMSRNNAKQQIDCCKKEQNEVKSLIKDKTKSIYIPMKLQTRLHKNNLTVMVMSVLTKPKQTQQ